MDVIKLDIFENTSSEKKTSSSENNNKKKSLFYQKFKSLKGSDKVHNPTPENVLDIVDLDFSSQTENYKENVLYSQDIDMNEIEEENIKKLEGYSSSEIKSLLSEVFSTLKPEQIEFLRTRARKKIKTAPVKEIDLEEEKTKWMKPIEEDIKPSKRSLIDGEKYRFDFEGRIISYPDNNMNVKLNDILSPDEERVLLHHGDEPNFPGYTIDELIHLSRSTFKAQRKPALRALKNIIYKAKRWLYKIPKENQEIYFVNTILLTHILNDGKLFIILRQLIDESNLSTLASAFEVLHTLFTNDCDEKVYSLVRRGWKGYESYPLYVYNKFEGKMSEETTDMEKVQLDLVLGYVNINFLERVRYILEVLNPDFNIVKNILEIILRFSRHSSEVSEEIANCPRFLYVLNSYLNENSDKRIIYITVKIIHALCQSSRKACELCIKEEIISKLVQYFLPVEDTAEEKTQLNIQIAMESLYTWEICLRYGLNISNTLNHLQMFTDMMKSNTYPSSKLIKSIVLRIFEAMTELAINLKENEPIPKGKVLWSMISPLFHQALLIIKSTSNVNDIEDHHYRTSAGHFISTYIERILNSDGFVLDEEKFHIQKIGHTVILPYLLSEYFRDLLTHCMNEEYWDENSEKNDILNIDKYCVSMVNHPSLSWKSQFFKHSTSYNGITLSILMNNLLSMLRVINIIGQLDPLFIAHLTASEIAGPLQAILTNYSTHAMKYSSSKPFLYCSRITHFSAYYLIKLLYHQSSVAQDASLICLGCLLPGDTEMAMYLVTRVIFFSHEDDPTFDLSNLNLQPKLVSFYYNLLNEESSLSKVDPSSKSTLNILFEKSSMPLGKTWPYLPILHYKEFIYNDKEGKRSIKQGVSFVRDALIFIKNLELTSGGYANKIKRSTKLYTIMNCFLLSLDIFANEEVKLLLESLFKAYIEKGWEPLTLSFSINVELLKNVISAWTSESYGDKTLGNFIVAWSLAGACLTEKQIEQSKHKEDLKTLENELWTEIEKLWHLLPNPPKNLEKYFYDVGMRRASLIPHYVKCLKSPHISSEIGKQSIYPQIFITNIETYLNDPNVNQFEKMYIKKLITDNEITLINI